MTPFADRRTAVVLVSLVLAAGAVACTSVDSTSDATPSTGTGPPSAIAPPSSTTPTGPTPMPSPATAVPTPGTPPPTASTSPRPDVPDDLEVDATACDDDRRSAVETVVRAQLVAFAAGDFVAARELASEGFRAGVDVDEFRALITDQYPVVLGDTDPAFGRCGATSDQAVVEVALAGPDGIAELVYLLVREPGGWAIEAAAYATAPGDATIET